MKPRDGRQRVVIEDVAPQIDAGAHPIQRVSGEEIVVTATVFADGHDHLAARLLYRHQSEAAWRFVPMRDLGNDLWTAAFVVDKLGTWRFTVQGWADHFATWASDFAKRVAAQAQPEIADAMPDAAAARDVALALLSGAILIRQAAQRARGDDALRLKEFATNFEALRNNQQSFYENPCTEELNRLMTSYPDLAHASQYKIELPVWVDRERARFSSWYELFPRSASPIAGRHGTLGDVEQQLPEIAEMGFDVVYLPPIHPSAAPIAKGQTIPPLRRPVLRGVRGPLAIALPCSVHRWARPLQAIVVGTNPSILSSARLLTLIDWSSRLILAASMWRSTLRSNVRQTIRGLRIIPTGLSRALTVQSNTLRILRKNIRIFIRSISRPATGATFGTSCIPFLNSGLNAECAFFASTIRTLRHCHSGIGV